LAKEHICSQQGWASWRGLQGQCSMGIFCAEEETIFRNNWG